jgi:hypothetical protein
MRKFMLGGAMPSRRSFLMLSAGAGALAVSGCGILTNNTGTTTTAWISAIQAIGAEAGQFVTQLSSVAGVPASVVSEAQTIIAEIQKAAAAVGSATTASVGQSVLQTIETYINDLAPLVLPFVSLIPGGSIIGLIVAALPAIEAMLNVAISNISSAAAQLAASAPALPASAKFGAVSIPVSQQYLNLLLNKASAKLGRKLRVN